VTGHRPGNRFRRAQGEQMRMTWNQTVRRSAGPCGFTLVELLVVVSIIIVLGSLSFLSSRMVRQGGQRVVSSNNLRQWGQAMIASLADRNNMMPGDGQGATPLYGDYSHAWFNVLPPYLNLKPLGDLRKEGRLPRPGERSLWINPAVPASVAKDFRTDFFCYAVNYYMTDNAAKPVTYVNAGHILFPASTVFMGEKNDNFASLSPNHVRSYFGTAVQPTSPDAMSHFVFCDGHVELIPRRRFSPSLGAVTEADPPQSGLVNFLPYPGAKH